MDRKRLRSITVTVNQILSKENIKLYSNEHKEKSSVVERWKSYNKRKVVENVYSKQQHGWIYYDKLDELVRQYNETKHWSLKMSPAEASRIINEKRVYYSVKW